MRVVVEADAPDGVAALNCLDTPLLGRERERQLLSELAELKRKLVEFLIETGRIGTRDEIDDPGATSRILAEESSRQFAMPAHLGADFARYLAVRTELAMANMRLVAHIVKRYRDRGVAYSDLIQEGFCGLLEAIDRFDMSHETRLSTYATWWIRQAVQHALASGAYPVRLSPRHLRQLARNQQGRDSFDVGDGGPAGIPSTSLQRIQAATRPAVSINASLDRDPLDRLSLAAMVPEESGLARADREELVEKLMQSLRPRERQVLSMRFGLGDRPKLSLSQVGKVLDVSKERVRQIQDRALAALRTLVAQDNLLGIY